MKTALAVLLPMRSVTHSWTAAALKLESLIAVGIVAVMLAAALQALSPLRGKAMLMGPMLAGATTYRAAAAERLALTGSPLPPAGTATTQLQDGRYDYEQVGAVVVARGQLHGQAGSRFALPSGPAWDTQGLGWHLRWMCGSTPVPDGWQQPPRPPVIGLRPGELPHVCHG